MQLTISQQLGLDPTTVANFFMNARRRGHDRTGRPPADGDHPRADSAGSCSTGTLDDDMSDEMAVELSPPSALLPSCEPPPIFEQL
uniref:Homeobox domain-containing protein n=1 Tax=Plectus sambesii TaxID=2011161 RepID=A0A914XMB2_9BILA